MHEYSKRGCDFMLRNKKGSTLATVLIVFSVLMIFGVFILGFMVNENKMALSHQKKTQAYYVARSGAVAVEAAIMELDETKIEELEMMLSGEVKVEPMSFGEGVANVTLSRDKDNMNNMLITSVGEINGESDTLTKVIRKYINTPIIALNSLSPNLENSNPIVARTATDEEIANGIYPDVEGLIPSSIPWNGGNVDGVQYNVFTPVVNGTMTLEGGTNGNVVNYVYDERLVLTKKDDKKLTLNTNGRVNLYIKGGLEIEENFDLKVNESDSLDDIDLNIYIVDDGSDASNPFIDIYFSNTSVVKANIITNTESKIRLYAQSESSNASFEGSIYAPKGSIYFGDAQKAAVSYKATIIGKIVELYVKNDKTNKDQTFIDRLADKNIKDIPRYIKGPFIQ